MRTMQRPTLGRVAGTLGSLVNGVSGRLSGSFDGLADALGKV